jgi:biofilm PGA synthesis N-glycosyltransferase PgaC
MLPSYVLITPARNEASFIELTIKSVARQTVTPLKWVIVSDGSTDGTDDIVRRYAKEYTWIELLRMPERKERHFAGKVQAFNAGYATVRSLSYGVIGNLDADISFDDQDYFAFLMAKFAEDVGLGVAGTPYKCSDYIHDYRFVNIEDVSGACQMFRRECFEEIGGYLPLKGGGVDHVAFLSARMKGWRTRTFTEKICLHHRQSGTAQRGVLMARFKTGALDYSLGSHPLWEIFRTFYQMTKKPFVIGALMLFAGYLWSLVRRAERSMPRDLVAFRRSEQMRRLSRLFKGSRTSPQLHAAGSS